MPIFDHFDFLAPMYETFIKPRFPQQLLSHLHFPICGALLDAGGGTGRISQFISGKVEAIVVVDFSHKMLSEARGKDGLHPVCSPTENLPFADESFAGIIMVDALHHVCDQRRTLAELWRTLQPGGQLIVEEPDLRRFGVKMLAVAEKLALMRSHFLSPPQIAGLLQYPNASVRIETEGSTAWVIAEKHPAGMPQPDKPL